MGPNELLLIVLPIRVSDPLSVPKTAQLMSERGISNSAIHETYQNALTVYSQNTTMSNRLIITLIKQNTQGNSILRGQKPKYQCPTL